MITFDDAWEALEVINKETIVSFLLTQAIVGLGLSLDAVSKPRWFLTFPETNN